MFLVLSCISSSALANYNGPFLLWGRGELKNTAVSTLAAIDEKVLQNIYSESSAIILFVRNASSRLSEENYPTFHNLVKANPYVYLTQHWLPTDPVDFNVNAEVSSTSAILSNIGDREILGGAIDFVHLLTENKPVKHWQMKLILIRHICKAFVYRSTENFISFCNT